MRNSPGLLALIILALCIPSLALRAMELQAQDVPPAPPQKPRLGLNLQRPISDTDAESYSTSLELAEPQKLFFSSAFERYEAKAKALIDTHIQEINALAETAMDALAPVATPEGMEAVAAVAEEENKLAKKLDALEDDLFLEVEGILAESQKPALQRVRSRAARAKCGHIGRLIPASMIDLERLVRSSSIRVDEPADDVILRYELEVTPVFTELNWELRERRIKSSLLDAHRISLRQADPGQNAQALARLDQSMTALLAKGARLQGRIAELNNRYAEELSAALPESDGARLLGSYRRAAYPAVYPDLENADEFFEKLVALDGLGDEVRSALTSLYDQHTQSYGEICKRMRVRFDAWREATAASTVQQPVDEYRDEMRALRDKRREASQRFVRLAFDMLPPDRQAQVRADFESWNAVLQTAVDSPNDGYPPR